ncbi:ASCH domain-containing protein [Gemmiger formicilis]|nr:ASCH domain-containing protein [Gemmiger formicilis]
MQQKRANTGLFSLFEAQMQLLPRTGDYTVVLDSDMQPRCITRTTKVEVVPFEDVTADCAAAEGTAPLPRGRMPTATRLPQRVRKSASILTKE